ncbi:MAG TPA: hypothetical protein V6C84_11700 [Coleofasciculaceae cyanobacterium]
MNLPVQTLLMRSPLLPNPLHKLDTAWLHPAAMKFLAGALRAPAKNFIAKI